MASRVSEWSFSLLGGVLVRWAVCWCAGRCAGVLGGVLVCPPVCWCAGVLGGLLVCWAACWCAGVLVCWCAGRCAGRCASVLGGVLVLLVGVLVSVGGQCAGGLGGGAVLVCWAVCWCAGRCAGVLGVLVCWAVCWCAGCAGVLGGVLVCWWVFWCAGRYAGVLGSVLVCWAVCWCARRCAGVLGGVLVCWCAKRCAGVLGGAGVLGVLGGVLVTLASVVANAVVTWNANEVTDPVLGNLQGARWEVHASGKFMQDIYEVSWMRAQPYLVGVGFAWLLEVLDQRRPSQGPQSEAAGPATTGPPVLPSLLRQVSRDSDGLKKDVADEEQGGGVTQQSLSAPAQVAAGDRAAGAVAAGRTPLLISQAEEEEERSSSRTWSCSESALARAWKAGSQNHSAYVAAALLLQLLSFVAMCFVVFVPVTRYRCSSLLACTSVETAPWSKMANVLYPTFCHLLWGLGLGCLMLLCFLRAPGTWWINSLLGHTAWQPPMKLSYMAYLVHPLVLVFFYCVQDQSVHYQDVWLVLNFVAISAFVFLAAFVLWICVEQPCANVTGRQHSSSKQGWANTRSVVAVVVVVPNVIHQASNKQSRWTYRCCL
ncbi:unnamed protein product [Polarella glacialis]|uniref:Acyltransferase 3 domain-containing protein n=2 Tax=Polarella glacialis TaxID=89957 RepID=A0A813GKQ0_POLGL|nr:unnamed protein product [Polarella glacialis]